MNLPKNITRKKKNWLPMVSGASLNYSNFLLLVASQPTPAQK